jgi:hypothetical protein
LFRTPFGPFVRVSFLEASSQHRYMDNAGVRPAIHERVRTVKKRYCYSSYIRSGLGNCNFTAYKAYSNRGLPESYTRISFYDHRITPFTGVSSSPIINPKRIYLLEVNLVSSFFHLCGKVTPLLLISTKPCLCMGNWRSASGIITLATGLRWVASFTTRSVYSVVESTMADKKECECGHCVDNIRK